MPSSSGSSSLTCDRDIPDARGCAFGLPGLLQGSALEVHVTAETVVEAYSIPWSLIQVWLLPFYSNKLLDLTPQSMVQNPELIGFHRCSQY